MSGSAGLAAARRRRAPEINKPNNLQDPPSVILKKPLNINPIVVLKNHDLILKEMINDIQQLKEYNVKENSQKDIDSNEKMKTLQNVSLDTYSEMMQLKKQVILLNEFMNKRTSILIDEDNSNLMEND